MAPGSSLRRRVLITAWLVFASGILDVGSKSIENGHAEDTLNHQPSTPRPPREDHGNIRSIPPGLVGGKGESPAGTWGLRLDMDALRMDIGTKVGPPIGPDKDVGASVYVRWGNGNCPGDAQEVYGGVIGGSNSHKHSGGAANHLCLPLVPEYTDSLPTPRYGKAPIYGVEYETKPHHSHNRDALCSVCRVPRATTLTIPARLQCPVSWTLEYSGYIMAGSPDEGRPSTEYLCVDSQLQGRKQSTVKDENEGVLYPAQTYCGSLPCLPFREGKNLPCVVCSL